MDIALLHLALKLSASNLISLIWIFGLKVGEIFSLFARLIPTLLVVAPCCPGGGKYAFHFVFAFLSFPDPLFQPFLIFNFQHTHLSLSQISDSSWLRCTSSSPIGLHFTDCSLVYRSSVVGVVWIVCFNGFFPSLRVNPLNTVVQQGSARSLAVYPFDPSADQSPSPYLFFFLSSALVTVFVSEDVLYGLEIWVMEIFRWVLCCCTCTGLFWLDSKSSSADLVTFLCHLWAWLVAATSLCHLSLVRSALRLKIVSIISPPPSFVMQFCLKRGRKGRDFERQTFVLVSVSIC
ncbi:uncharacterized protein LOC133711385 [Rosa rugosa]|uniref:uncharacterized protein LOC133711385 n=1 Tax=Rosa rugosa TaxID=74645 RepID=UPI002B40DC01|nr:uncharacterized protein LOC133711385 [Rosa rugosa]